jgi:uncharacterized protein YyaL (SSP411 family)
MANKLINEQSPYLLQHAHNPVDWHPWGDEAFELAQAAHKPVLVSIGYAACHWCHVMEKESFENDEVAGYMNEHFICIKVDREEHPDVDHMYMDAVQAISGNGGWPLNVFVTPSRAPFYGGTYFPPRAAFNRPSWMQVLERMSEIWHEQQDEVDLQSSQMLEHLRQASLQPLKKVAGKPDADMCRTIADNLLKQGDQQKGGFGNAPKFPGTMAISYLLEHYHFTGYEPALKHALLSLDSMIAGGIYDQLGGGFSRYATDRDWLIPHFEKMLYDNALLVCALCDAYSITKDPKYKIIIGETLAFAERELKDKKGGYYCALDADSEGVEGKFYTWTWEEWQAVAGDDNQLAAAYFGVVPEGNWEETNILHVPRPLAEVAAEFGCTIEEANKQIKELKSKLLTERQNRIRPQTDDKSLLSWNALMNMALSRAGTALGEQQYISRAKQHMEWMVQQFCINGVWLHTWKNGVAKISAKLDDYACLAQAMLQLATAAGNNQLILQASELLKKVSEAFSQEELFFYYTSSDQRDIPVRKVDLYDGATPSANAVMAHNLWLCGACMGQSEWLERAVRMLEQVSDTVMRYSYSFGYWAILLQRYHTGMRTVVCSGPGAAAESAHLRECFMPQVYTVTLEKEISELPIAEKKYFADKLLIFVCTEKACLSPVSGAEAALQLIEKYR